MSTQLLSSKIVIQEEEPQQRPVPGVPTAVPGFVGVCERGPMDVATMILSPEQYRRLFGGYTTSGEVAQAVDGFFAQGGNECFVSRTCHHTDPTDPTTKTSAAAAATCQTAAGAPTSGRATAGGAGPYALSPAQTLVCAIDGGGDQTFTFNATQASRTDAGVYPVALADGQTLLLALDGGAVQTITFHTANFVAIGAATAAEVAAVINGQIVGGSASVVGGHVKVISDKSGTASGVNISGGTANAALVFTTGNQAGTGNVANIKAVTASEVQSIIAATLTGAVSALVAGVPTITSSTTGGASTVLVKNTSTALAIGFDNATHTGLTGSALNTLTINGKTDGAYANLLSAVVEAATSGEANRFNLRVVKAAVTIETWPNLTMDATDPRYAPAIVNDANNGSVYISLVDLFAATPSPNNRPGLATYALSGGSDGLTSLADNDFIGGSGPNGRVGLRTLDLVPELSLLAVPGRATSAVHNAMIAYCETTRSGAVFAVLDPPASTTAAGMGTYMQTTAAILELSEYFAMYWPRIKVANPNNTVFGSATLITVAPSGYVCGVMARNDSARDGGVYDAPAGIEKGVILGCLGFETDEVLDESARDLIYPKRINPIRTGVGQPRYIDGSRTGKSTGNFPSVSERRGVIFIEQSVKAALEFARHRNNDETLRAEVTRTVESFLITQMKNRAFRSQDPVKAFFVDFSNALNSDAIAFAGKLIGRVGLATQKPAEFIILRFSQFVTPLAA